MNRLWPLENAVDDPHADIHWQLVGYGYEDYRAHGGRLDLYEYEQLCISFDQRITSGELDIQEQTLQTLRLKPPYLLPAIPPTESYRPMAEADIIRIATDYLPSLGQDAPDLVYGPWRDELDPARALDRQLLRRALSIAGVEAIQGSRFSGCEMWARSNITPTVEARARMRMVADAPHSLWRISNRDGDLITLEDLIGLDAAYLPPGPVRLRNPLSHFRIDGPYVLARVAYTPTGWEAHLPLVIPTLPHNDQIHHWIRQELWHARLRNRRITLERMLRRRGHVLIRRLHEWLWLKREVIDLV